MKNKKLCEFFQFRKKVVHMTNFDHFITHKPLISEESVDDQEA